MRKGASSLKPHEMNAFSALQKKMPRRWEFVVQQAADQINAEQDRTNVQQAIFDSQERAYWYHYRLPKDKKADLKRAIEEQQEACEMAFVLDPKASRAQDWGDNLLSLLNCPLGRVMFKEFVRSEHSEENLTFWEECQKFQGIENPEDLPAAMKAIFNRYLIEGASSEVNIPANIRSKVQKRVNDNDVSRSTFDDAVLSIQSLMNKDSYTRFLKSKPYLDLVHQYEVYQWLTL